MTAEDANRAQRKAVDPLYSVWVAASAGTGKTKVLTDRLLRLMLGGTDPARILCLTFTRAAAAEMANRLNVELAKWATLPPGALTQALVALTGDSPSTATRARARQLFAQVLDAAGGANIATIHGFCQSLLRRFPLEADVPPEFAVLDERGAAEARAEAAEAIVIAARGGGEPDLAEALAIVARYAPEDRFAGLMQALANDRGKLRRALADGAEALRERLLALLALPPGTTPGTLLAAFCAGGDAAGLRDAAAALAAGSSTDCARGAVLAQWWAEAAAARPAMIEPYRAAYLTASGEIRKQLITKKAASLAGGAPAVLADEAARVQEFCQAHAAAELVAASVALARLGGALVAAYERRKRLHGLLDYDDLVTKAVELLHRPGIAPWVLFKLDGGLDHILIDEAQDTNPEQWAIVAALADEFFAGEDPRGRTRTVFAVGDTKQSIYSFQRADPQAFLSMRRHFEERINDAKQKWRTVPLEISFRATEPLLRAVDAIFAGAAAADGVALDGGPIRHVAARAGHAGLVELWPPVVPEAEEALDAQALPLTRRRVVQPQTRLAAAIAATIAGWLATGERLETRARALRAGDVIVLVRRRTPFVGELVRALKQRGVAVAGADRLVLSTQIAVQDLVALGRFLLLPEDDLTLATVLKGPLFGISEEALFDLAHGRGEESLWLRLRRRAGAAFYADAAARLSAWLARADFVPPYELYAEILGEGGGRRQMLERLGPEAADAIEELLSLALAYEREHVPSLQGFLRWLAADDTAIRRDFAEHRRDEVRILTVHGAKGLEAPVVFLPDTMQLPDPRLSLLWSERHHLPLWSPRRDHPIPFHDSERRLWHERQLQEYRRLLYVALTRAEDRLYICGWQNRREPSEACWHFLCRAGLAGIAERFSFDTTGLIGQDGWTGEGMRLSAPQREPARRDKEMPALPGPAALPEWAQTPPAPEPEPPRPLLPSRPDRDEPAPLSPLAGGGGERFKRGLVVHRLLQMLPGLPAESREAAARQYLALKLHGLDPATQDELCRETMGVLDDPGFAALFGPNSQAEVPLVGLVGRHALSGQIDRLVVEEGRVLIVDYKTLRPPPATAEAVPPVYLRQLALYRAALAEIYPGRAIECALLWTDGPRLMPVSSEILARHLALTPVFPTP